MAEKVKVKCLTGFIMNRKAGAPVSGKRGKTAEYDADVAKQLIAAKLAVAVAVPAAEKKETDPEK